MSGRPRIPRASFAIALLALVLRLGLAFRPLVLLDRLFVPDDAYYTLAIARSIARGLGPSVDGVHLTSGFQPLLAFLLAPVVRAGLDPDACFRAALVVGAVADGVSTWLFAWIGTRIGGRATAIAASTIWALSTAAIATSLNGLETSLAIACLLGALAAWIRSIERRDTGLRRWVWPGILLGVCLLARVDTAFFVAIVGVATFRRAGLRAAAVAAVAALVVVAPWWAYSLARFGSLIPESGAAVREQALMYKVLGINIRDQLAWVAGAAVGPPLLDATWLRQALGSGASAIGFAVAIGFVVAALRTARRPKTHDAVRILAGHAAILCLFYGLYLPATWFFRRYLVPVHAFVALTIALWVAEAWRGRVVRPVHFHATAAIVAACSFGAVTTLVRFATATPTRTVDEGHHGAKGYREPARQILALAPPHAVVGSFQSGALAWFADGTDTRVVNLDGVVDGEAARAVREHRIAAFARARGVTHLADWKVNIDLFLARSGDPRVGSASLDRIGEAESQGDGEHFVLYAVQWP